MTNVVAVFEVGETTTKSTKIFSSKEFSRKNLDWDQIKQNQKPKCIVEAKLIRLRTRK